MDILTMAFITFIVVYHTLKVNRLTFESVDTTSILEDDVE
jgi:hypothetical protein